MFRNNMIVALKCGELFFAENSDGIRIPFGTEYSLYMKNQNDTDALVSIKIDGKDVLSGSKIILRSKSILDLEGFLDGNFVKDKFKFIERTKEIENFSGVNPEDGIISVTFDYEKRKPSYQPYIVYYPKWEYSPYISTTSISGSSTTYVYSSFTANANNSNSQMYLSSNLNTNNENGITVRGSDTNQSFGFGWLGEMENNPTTISFKLFGFHGGDVKVFTRDRIRCSVCGRTSKVSNKFCPNCGTKLQIK